MFSGGLLHAANDHISIRIATGMRKVLTYSLLLVLGLAGTQVLAVIAPDVQANTATIVRAAIGLHL